MGKIGPVYVDETTGQPEWMTVNTGLFGTKETFVPLEPAEVQGDEVVVPFQKEQIKDAPNVDTRAGGRLPEEEEVWLYEHYGMSSGTSYARTDAPGTLDTTLPARPLTTGTAEITVC